MAERFDLAVIGAGPGGLAAARAALEAGRRVALIDAQPHPGGQVWRHDLRHGWPLRARHEIHEVLRHPLLRWYAGRQVIQAQDRQLLVQDEHGAEHIHFAQLVLATGARELLLPFPGWTLPAVSGAGGLQALAKQGWPLEGRRVVVAGSGPLLLAAALTARKHGAQVLGIYEQASAEHIQQFARELWRWPGKAWQAALLRLQLLGIPYRCGAVVREAFGGDQLAAVEIEYGGGREHIHCDHLAVGYGLVPNTELAIALGCRLRAHGAHHAVDTDDLQRSSVSHIYAVGEACGIGGRDSALLEGRIAGLVASGQAVPAALLAQRDHARAFATSLHRHFALGEPVRSLARGDTLVCRCEDVSLAQLQAFDDARAAKLQTRCGMGACQGRICSAALAELGLPAAPSARPPFFPARLASLAEPLSDDVQGFSS